MASAELSDVLRQFARRYRTAVAAKAAVLAALSLGVSGGLAWRLHLLRLHPLWSVGLPSAVALLAAAGLGWWLRRTWLSHRATAAYVDERLGLQQRLLTAAEFAETTPPPALYPLLVEDVQGAAAMERLRVPQPFDRTAGALAAFLLLLVLWPGTGSRPTQVAQRPHQPPQLPPPEPPPPDEEQTRDQSSPSAAGQPGRSDATGEQEDSSGSGQSQQTQDGSGQQPRAGQQPQDAQGREGASQDGQGRQQSDAQRRNGETDASSSAPSSGRGEGADQQQDRGAAQRSSQTSRSTSQGQQPGQGQPQSQQGGQGRSQQGGQGRSQQAAASLQQAEGRGSGPRPAASESRGGPTTGDGEALRADIQRLLKEVSGELQQLQEQLAKAQDQSQAAPGTGSDPNLYGTAESLAAGGATSLPIALKTDTAPTRSRRKGGGTGAPSGQVSGAAPQLEAEEAQLSAEPLEEPSAARQPIPPEYRSVFDQLRNPNAQPSEATP